MLILFPDGSGSATSYAAMAPFMRPSLAVVGLNCPYLRHPEEMSPEKISLDALMEAYLTEIRRRQPAGPYRLGGWSSGGILAFRAAQMLIQQGEQVSSLVLIDAPPPTGLDPLPARWYDYCFKANIFGNMPGSTSSSLSSSSSSSGTRGLPAALIPHFRAQVAMLQNYVADPLPEGFTPRTSILWAGRRVFDGSPGRPVFETRPEDPEGIKFLTEQRTDWSAGSWSKLLPLDEPEVHIMEGEDHFSMMQTDCGERLGRLVSDACL
jgi:surfactin synthase thioesterase subunit